MSRVSTTLSADASAYVREMQKANAELARMVTTLEKVGAANNKVAEQSQKVAKEQETVAGKAVTNLTAWIAGYVSLQSAMRLVSEEMRNQLDMQTKMAAAQNTVAAAEQRLAMNAASPAEFQKLRGLAQSVASQTGIPMQAALDAAGAANSAKGGAGFDAVSNAMMVAGRAMPNNVSEIPTVASALLDARLVTGSTDAMLNYGKLAALQADSRPVSLPTTARYLLPGAKGAQSILPAENPYEWLATAGMMTSEAIDPSGEKTGGAMQVIAGKMKDFFNNPEGFEKPGGGYDKGAKLLNWYILQQATGGMAPEAGRARRFLQDNPYWKELFLGDAKLGVRAIPGAAAMLDPAYEKQIQSNIANMEAATAARAETQLGTMEDTPANRTARVSRIAERAVEFAQLEDTFSGKMGAIRGSMSQIEQALGYSAAGIKAEEFFTFTSGFLGRERQASDLSARASRALGYARQNGDGELEKQLTRLIATLDSMAAEVRQGNRAPVNLNKHGE